MSSFNLLAISASTSLCSIVLETPYQRYEWQTTDSNQHSEQLLPAIQQLLNQAGLIALNANDFIAADIGPGSFTSVRVACSVAQGLALGWGCQVVAVESLTAMVHQHLSYIVMDSPTYIMAVIDARMNECYAAQYYYDIDNSLRQTAVPMLIPYHFKMANVDTIQKMYHESNILIGNVIDITDINNINDTNDIVCKNSDNNQINNTAHNKLMIRANPSARGVLLAAKIYIQQGLFSSHLDQLQPLYVRNQVALTTLERALIK